MNLKKSISSKRGSYIVEAALTLPICILFIIAVSLVIEMYSAFECMSAKLHSEAKEISYVSSESEAIGLLKLAELKPRLKKSDERIDKLEVSGIDYLFRKNDIDSLISVTVKTDFRISNPIGFSEKLSLKEKVIFRSFSGKNNEGKPLGVKDFEADTKSAKVFVFPRYGYSYHISTCQYVKKQYKNDFRLEMEREEAKLEGYVPCKVCKGGGA